MSVDALIISFGIANVLAAIPITPGGLGYVDASYIGMLVGVTLLGIWICGRAASDLGVHDHPGIVWDEIAGYLLTMTAAPAGWLWILVGFGLFRLFDIWKPWPIGWLDRRVGGGLGIMLDDLVAGVLAAACLQLIAALL